MKKKNDRGVQALLFAAANVERSTTLAKKKPEPDILPKREAPARKPARSEEPRPAERTPERDEGNLFDGHDDESSLAHHLSQLEREVSREYGVPLTVIPEPRRVCQQLFEVEVDKEERRRRRFSSD